MENSDHSQSEEEHLDAIKRRWEQLKEKARQDFYSINANNQQKVTDTKLKIAEYVKGAVTFLKKDTTPSTATSPEIPLTLSPSEPNQTLTNNKQDLIEALTLLQETSDMIFSKANKEFQTTVDAFKDKIARSVKDAQENADKNVLDNNKKTDELVGKKMNDLKETVRQTFLKANEEARKAVEETKVKIARSMQNMTEAGQEAAAQI